MITHYIKIAFRYFLKDKVYSVINLVGLSLAVACSFMVMLWVQYENNYENTHDSRKQIYRVLTIEDVGGEQVKRAVTPAPLGQALVNEFPAVMNATFFNVHRSPDVVVYNEQPYAVNRGETNNRFFEVFTFEFLQGTPKTAFDGERPIVLSEDFAQKIFGAINSNIIGQPIYERYSLWGNPNRVYSPFIITAVVRVPKNTHIQFDILVDGEKTSQHGNAIRSWEAWYHYTTFVQMNPNVTLTKDTRARMADFLAKHLPDDHRKLVFQPLTDIHLRPDVADTNLSGEFGESLYIFIFLSVAIFVLAIAIINYVNLSIARGANRSREAGIRKVGGAFRHELVLQFLVESMIWAFVAMLLAFYLVNRIIPWFSGIMGTVFHIDYSLRTFLTAIGITLFVGLLAGSYPAFYLSSIRPMLSLKGGSLTGSKSTLRKTLLAVQLAISIFIMLCTGIVYRQLHYIQNRNIGFDRFNVIGVNIGLWRDPDNFKQEVLKNVNVEAASFAISSPIKIYWKDTLKKWEGKTADTQEDCNFVFCDGDYAKVFCLQMTQGSFIRDTSFRDSRSGTIALNETAVKLTGIQDIVGTKVNDREVAGVVKDFNFRSFHEKIPPLILAHDRINETAIFFRISPHNRKETLNYIREVFQKFKKDVPFEYFYVEDEYMAMYQKEFRLGRLFLYFSLLSIFISCMGVFSLVSFMIKQRSKEIAIRKINGANAADVLTLFFREFSALTIVSFVVASPFAWFAMHRWLQSFQYRVGISWWIFIGVSTLILALVIISLVVQVYRAARRNPVESLKYE